jgi:hypothetical protein
VGSGQAKVTLPAMERVVAGGASERMFAETMQTTYGGICGSIEQIGSSNVVALIH